ncbi:MAG: hypothetical protein KUF74_15780 [Candidatus Thiodiazotropha sp. (ex Ctena orbiculata)]|nr:hypothetical protein [Candidatus Thiodiazotropha taylori]
MTELDLLVAAGASVTTGGVSALATVKALGVHISYIKENLVKVERSNERAHDRITKVEDTLDECRMTMARLHPGEHI